MKQVIFIFSIFLTLSLFAQNHSDTAIKLNVTFDTTYDSGNGEKDIHLKLTIENHSKDTIYYYAYIGWPQIIVETKNDTSWTELVWPYLINQIVWPYGQIPLEIFNSQRSIIREKLFIQGTYRIKFTYYTIPHVWKSMFSLFDKKWDIYKTIIYSKNFEIN
jgi:hypothetical protein